MLNYYLGENDVINMKSKAEYLDRNGLFLIKLPVLESMEGA